MLAEVGLLTPPEAEQIAAALDEIGAIIDADAELSKLQSISRRKIE